MKKVISIFLMLCLMFSISVPAFAADSDLSITVDSNDVIALSDPIEPPEIISRGKAPQVTAVELYGYGWIDGTDRSCGGGVPGLAEQLLREEQHQVYRYHQR